MKYAEILRSQVAEIEAQREAIKAEAEALSDAIVGEARSATPDEDTKLSELAARSAALKAEAAAKVARADELDALEVERRAAPTFIHPADKPSVLDVRSMNLAQVTDTIVRAAEDREIDSSHARTLLRRHGGDIAWARQLAARSTDAYTSGFKKLVTGNGYLLTDEERASMAVGTNTAGAVLVPTHLDPTLIMTNTGSANIVRQLARNVTLTQGNVWNGITTAGVSASFDSELAEVSDDSPNDFAKSSITVHTARAFVQASVEAFEDIDNLAADVLMLFSDARTRLEGAAHCVGTGTGQPWGVFAAVNATTARRTTSTTAATIGVVDLQAMKRAVGIRWRSRGSWLMAPIYADAIKNLGTALSNAYSTDLTQENTARLFGRPAYESDDAPTTQTTTALDQEVVFGDFSNYVIVDKPGSFSLSFLPPGTLTNTANNLPDGRVAWFGYWRTGADSVNDSAFSILVDKTSA